MNTSGLRLSWKSHDSHIVGIFEKLWESRALCDVTLACQGGNIRAHRVILSACSPYFQELFEENPCQHPTIVLKDVSYPHLVALLHFMYRGEVEVDQADLPHVIMIAASLRIRELAEIASHIELNSPSGLSMPGSPQPAAKRLHMPALKRRHDTNGGSLVKVNDASSVGSSLSGNSDSEGGVALLDGGMKAPSPANSKRQKTCSFTEGNGAFSDDSYADHHDNPQDSPSSVCTVPHLVLETEAIEDGGEEDEDEDDDEVLGDEDVDVDLASDSEKPLSLNDDGSDDEAMSPSPPQNVCDEANGNAVGSQLSGLKTSAREVGKMWSKDSSGMNEIEVQDSMRSTALPAGTTCQELDEHMGRGGAMKPVDLSTTPNAVGQMRKSGFPSLPPPLALIGSRNPPNLIAAPPPKKKKPNINNNTSLHIKKENHQEGDESPKRIIPSVKMETPSSDVNLEVSRVGRDVLLRPGPFITIREVMRYSVRFRKRRSLLLRLFYELEEMEMGTIVNFQNSVVFCKAPPMLLNRAALLYVGITFEEYLSKFRHSNPNLSPRMRESFMMLSPYAPEAYADVV